MDQFANNAAALAGWWVAHRLLALLVERGLLTHQDAIQVLDEGEKACAAGDPNNQAAAALLKQAKAHHEEPA
jgi:hypothetical protein